MSAESTWRLRSVPSVVRRARMTFTAKRCSHVPNAASPRNVASLVHARTNTSCAMSSACSGPTIRRTRLCTRATWARYRRSKARPSPEAASAASALGHTASVGLVVGAIILFGLHLPDRLWPAADLLVALLLIGLGGTVILRYARGRWHLHVHSHAAVPHLHLHSHAQGSAHEH